MPMLSSDSSKLNSPNQCMSSSSQRYDRGFSFFSFHSANRPQPDTLTTLNRTPGMSPFALPLRPNPASRTSSFSSTKFKQPSLGTETCVSLPFVICTLLGFFLNSGRRCLHAHTGSASNSPNAVTFFPFLMSCTRTHFRIALLGCFASTPTFSRTIPLACDEPPKGEDL